MVGAISVIKSNIACSDMALAAVYSHHPVSRYPTDGTGWKAEGTGVSSLFLTVPVKANGKWWTNTIGKVRREIAVQIVISYSVDSKWC